MAKNAVLNLKYQTLKNAFFYIANCVQFLSKMLLTAHSLVKNPLKSDCNFARCALNALRELETTLDKSRLDLYRY